MRTLGLAVRALLHGTLLFVLPWIVGVLAALFFDVAEVSETLSGLSSLFSAFAVPLALLQLVAVGKKVARDKRELASRGARGIGPLVEAVDRHVRVLTPRGVGLLLASLAMVALALSAKWAQFGVLAVAGIGLVYAASTVATLVSAFGVQAFDDRVRRSGGRIEREMSPPIVDAGDPVDERFRLARLPVPPAFRLHIHEVLPARLGGETRFVADPRVSSGEASLVGPLPRTPRGEYALGPATIWYEDVLGLTRVRVAMRATAFLRVLPRLRPVALATEARSRTQREGPFSALSRRPVDDYFRVRAYQPGDDARRVHWKLSLKAGSLQVRQPETVPISRKSYVLVLDTYLPRELAACEHLLAEALDVLVEGWVSVAHELVRRGEKVTLVAGLPELSAEDEAREAEKRGARSPSPVSPRAIECKRGEERRWRAAGAGARWQDAVAAVDAATSPASATATATANELVIVFSAGLGPLALPRSTRAVFVLVDAAAHLPEPEPAGPFMARVLFDRYPVGAEDNRLVWRDFFARRKRQRSLAPTAETLRRALALALTTGSSGAARFVLRRVGPNLVLEPAGAR